MGQAALRLQQAGRSDGVLMRMRNADTSSWIELRSHEIDEPLSEDGRDVRWWSRAAVSIGIAIMATATMTLVLYHLYLALGETVTGSPGARPTVAHVAVIITLAIGAVLIATGVVARRLESPSGPESLKEQTPAHATNGHRSGHLVA